MPGAGAAAVEPAVVHHISPPQEAAVLAGEEPQLSRQPLITLLTDYGRDGELVGVCHGVIARIAPQVRVIDIAHGLPPRDILPAALTLRNALEYFPPGIHVAVVDPGVGSVRLAVALLCEGERVLVGPDNGVLSLALEQSGGARGAFDIGNSPYRLTPVSPTFHGRDIFCPVAANLAAGVPLEEVGEPLDPARLQKLELPVPKMEPGHVQATAVQADRFGNVQLNLASMNLRSAGITPGQTVTLLVGSKDHRATWADTYSDVNPGDLLIYEDSYGAVALAVNGGSAEDVLKLKRGEQLEVRGDAAEPSS